MTKSKGISEFVIRHLSFVILAACASLPTPSAPAVASPPIDRLFLFVRDWPREDVELTLIRDAGKSTVTLIRPARPGRPRVLLDSIGPGEKDAQLALAMLDSFDIWAMNAPNAAGAACKTRNGNRSCSITFNDYSLVMKVESGGEVRVQRYTHLEGRTSSRSARALGDFVLAWARNAGMLSPRRKPGSIFTD